MPTSEKKASSKKNEWDWSEKVGKLIWGQLISAASLGVVAFGNVKSFSIPGVGIPVKTGTEGEGLPISFAVFGITCFWIYFSITLLIKFRVEKRQFSTVNDELRELGDTLTQAANTLRVDASRFPDQFPQSHLIDTVQTTRAALEATLRDVPHQLEQIPAVAKNFSQELDGVIARLSFAIDADGKPAQNAPESLIDRALGSRRDLFKSFENVSNVRLAFESVAQRINDHRADLDAALEKCKQQIVKLTSEIHKIESGHQRRIDALNGSLLPIKNDVETIIRYIEKTGALVNWDRRISSSIPFLASLFLGAASILKYLKYV